MTALDTITRYFRTDRKDVAFICGVLDALEGMVAVRSPKSTRGSAHQILHVMISPFFVPEFTTLLTRLKKTNTLDEVFV